MITERKIRRHFLLGLFWMISVACWGQVEFEYPVSEKHVSYNNTQLVNEDIQSIPLDGCISVPCETPYKKVYLLVEFTLAEDYADITGPGSIISSGVDVTVTGNPCPFLGIPTYEVTKRLEINTNKPRQVFKINLTDYYFTFEDIAVNIANYNVPVGYESSVQLNVGYEAEFLFKTDSKITEATDVLTTDPTTNSTKTFNWSVDCGHFEMYEFQLLKLYNKDEINALTNDQSNVIADVDWSKALTIHTHSWKQALKLTLGEGTGYYTWRVRGIGNEFSGGEGNPENWGDWSEHILDGLINVNPASYTVQPHTFFYEQFDEDKNWMYSRSFIEGEKNLEEEVKIGEQITYANGLLQTKQAQSILNTNEQVVATESVYDYSGRAALNSIGAPVYGQNSLGYKEGFFLSNDGTSYDASNFDENINYNSPEVVKLDGAGNGFGYYSDYNLTETYVASAADPTDPSIGYPFSRTRFYNDGRAKESSGVGYDLRMQNDPGVTARTTRVFYGGVADDELLRVLGNEAPDAGSVHKVVTVDPNKTTTITYMNKAGQTLFTCLGLPNESDDDYALLALDSQENAIYEVNEFVDPLITTSDNVLERVKDIILTAPTSLAIDYNIATNLIENTCANFCSSCDYKLEIIVTDKETNLVVYSYQEMIDPTTGCAVESNVMPLHDVSLGVGEYRIEQRLIANGIAPGSLNTQLEEHLTNLTDYLTENILGSPSTPTADLYEFMSDIDNNDLVGLYDHLEASPAATSMTDANGDLYYNVEITIESDEPCLTIQIPVLECESNDCPETGTSYISMLDEYGYGLEILEYEYAQDLYHNYTAEELNILIANMIEDGADPCQLWHCWRSQVIGYENALAVEVSLNNTPEGATYQYNFMNSFLDCARASQYPDGNYPLVAGTINPEDIGTNGGYIWSAHNHFYYEIGTYDACLAIFDPVGAPGHTLNTTDWDDNTLAEMQGFYGCISHIDQGAVVSEVEDYIYESMQSGCEATCESKRDAFEDEIINLYRSEGKRIEGDDYLYILNPAGGLPLYVADLDAPYAGPYDYTLDEIECAIDVLVEYCKGNCEVSNPITAEQEANIATVLTNTFTLSRPHEEFGCREDDLATSDIISSDYLIYWDVAETDGLIHSASPSESLIDMEQAGSGHISVLAGNRVTKYKSSGQIEWTQLFDTEFGSARIQGVQVLAGGYLLSLSNYLLVRLDGSGNIVWIKDYSANVGVSAIQYASKPVQTENGDIYILWYAIEDGVLKDIIIHTDDSGNFDWKYTNTTVTLGNNKRAVFEVLDNNVIVGSSNGEDVYAVDNSGNQIWNASPDFSDPFVNIRGVAQINDNEWAVIGNNDSENAIIYSIESDGTVLNSGIPDELIGHIGRDVDASEAGDYLAATTKDLPLVSVQFIVSQMTGGSVDWEEGFGSDREELNCQLLSYPNGSILLGGTSPDGEVSTTVGYKENTTDGSNFWETWFIKFKYHSSSCHPLDLCVSWAPLEIDDVEYPEPTVFEYQPCEEVQSSYLLTSITNQVGGYINQQKLQMVEEYEEQCLIPENIQDELKLTYQMAGYHYMLYYHDRSGQLVKTVPPEGVELQDLTDPLVQSRTKIPVHILVTDYQYNSLGQMVRSHSPDGGEMTYYYDKNSRLRFSQNAEQLVHGAYSYMKYDRLGRVVESGESTQEVIGLNFITYSEDENFPTLGNSDWTKSVYNTPAIAVDYKGVEQQFLRNRISYIYNDEGAYTYYSYDPHGNVEWVIQEIPDFDRFSMAYEYDLLSGNVLMVSYNDYNESNPDRFFHRYAYDTDNRLVTTETSTDLVIWDVDESNQYNSIGMMNRKITGQDMVQGTDYVFTLHGWLKGINHSSLSKVKDPGQDGLDNTVAADAFGMVLNYYEGDYRRNSGIGAAYTTADEDYLAGTHDLFNGNISSWTSRIPDQVTGGVDAIEHAGNVTGFTYRYDELQRIKTANFNTRDANDAAAIWNASDNYHTEYSFDANGNLTQLDRNAYTGVLPDLIMDNIEYSYSHIDALGAPIAVTALNYESLNNRLLAVFDGKDAVDIDDIEGGHDYVYDEIGRLIADPAEDISSITWTAFQKVESIVKTTGEEIRFRYDALGNRIAKLFIHPSDPEQSKTTFYVRDAQGNAMATYTKSYVPTIVGHIDRYTLTEHEIYGRGRLGLHAPKGLVVKEVDQDGVEQDAGSYIVKSELVNWNFSIQNNYVFGGVSGASITEMNFNSMTEVAGASTFTGGIGNAGKNNAVLEDVDGNLILTASTHRTYNGVSNVCVLRDAAGDMVTGANYIVSDWNGQSIFVKEPDSDDYYLVTTTTSGELRAHRINNTGSGYEVMPTVTTITGDYTDGLAVIDDRSGDFDTQILAIRKLGTSSELVSITVFNTADIGMSFSAPIVLQTFDEEIQKSNITLSPQGDKLAISAQYTEVIDIGMFTISAPVTILYHNELDAYATISLEAIHSLGAFTECNDIGYAPLGNHLFYAQKGGATGVHRWNLAGVIEDYNTLNMAIRIGDNGDLFALRNYNNDGNDFIYSLGSPDGAVGPIFAADILPDPVVPFPFDNFFKGDIPLHPHVILSDGDEDLYTRCVGEKMYECKDHLGNVRAVVTDRKLYDGTNYTADVVSIADYYPYGMQMPGRHQSTNVYRYGFQGQEKDDEIKGEGNSVNYKYRMHDARIGRFFAVDPLASKYPHNSSYAFSENVVINAVELEGLEKVYVYNRYWDSKLGKTVTKFSHIEVNARFAENVNRLDVYNGYGHVKRKEYKGLKTGKKYIAADGKGDYSSLVRTFDREEDFGSAYSTSSYIGSSIFDEGGADGGNTGGKYGGEHGWHNGGKQIFFGTIFTVGGGFILTAAAPSIMTAYSYSGALFTGLQAEVVTGIGLTTKTYGGFIAYGFIQYLVNTVEVYPGIGLTHFMPSGHNNYGKGKYLNRSIYSQKTYGPIGPTPMKFNTPETFGKNNVYSKYQKSSLKDIMNYEQFKSFNDL